MKKTINLDFYRLKKFFNLFSEKHCNNYLKIGSNINIRGKISGQNNKIIIGDARLDSKLKIYINGNNNAIKISNSLKIKDLQINIGNHIPVNNVVVEIGENLSCEKDVTFLMYENDANLIIGNNCMFSKNINIRCGEVPHLIFSLEDGKYIGKSDGVFIGNHVWIGEKV